MKSAHSMMPDFSAASTDSPAARKARRKAHQALVDLTNNPNDWSEAFIASHMGNPGFLSGLQSSAATPGATPDAATVLATQGINPTSSVAQKIIAKQADITQAKADFERARVEQATAAAISDYNSDQTNSFWGYGQAFAQTLLAAGEATWEEGINAIKYGVDRADGGTEPKGSWEDIFNDLTLGQMSVGAAEFYGAPTLPGVGAPRTAERGTLNKDLLDWGQGVFIDPESHASKIKEEYDRILLGTQYGKSQKVTRQEMDEDGNVRNVTELLAPPASLGQYAADTYLHADRDSTSYSIVSGLIDGASRMLDPQMYTGAKEFGMPFVSGQNRLAKWMNKPDWRIGVEGDMDMAAQRGAESAAAGMTADATDDAVFAERAANQTASEADRAWADIANDLPDGPSTMDPVVDEAVRAGQAERTMSFVQAHINRTATREHAAHQAEFAYDATTRELGREVDTLKSQADEARYSYYDDYIDVDVFAGELTGPPKRLAIEGPKGPDQPQLPPGKQPVNDTFEVGPKPQIEGATREITPDEWRTLVEAREAGLPPNLPRGNYREGEIVPLAPSDGVVSGLPNGFNRLLEQGVGRAISNLGMAAKTNVRAGKGEVLLHVDPNNGTVWMDINSVYRLEDGSGGGVRDVPLEKYFSFRVVEDDSTKLLERLKQEDDFLDSTSPNRDAGKKESDLTAYGILTPERAEIIGMNLDAVRPGATYQDIFGEALPTAAPRVRDTSKLDEVPVWRDVDSRGHAVWYHRSRAEFEMTPGGEHARNRNGETNLYHSGLYTSDSNGIKGATLDGYGDVVYQIEEKVPVKMFDLEDQLPPTKAPHYEETKEIFDANEAAIDELLGGDRSGWRVNNLMTELTASEAVSMRRVWTPAQRADAMRDSILTLNDDLSREGLPTVPDDVLDDDQLAKLYDLLITREDLDEMANGQLVQRGSDDWGDLGFSRSLPDEDSVARGLVQMFEDAAGGQFWPEEMTDAEMALAQAWNKSGYARSNRSIPFTQLLDDIPFYDEGRGAAYDMIRTYLKSHGFGGFSHEGGRMGGEGHLVKIYWDPANQVRIHRVNPDAPYDPAGVVAASKGQAGAGQTVEEVTTQIDGFDVTEVVNRAGMGPRSEGEFGLREAATGWSPEKAELAMPVKVLDNPATKEIELVHVSGKVVAKAATAEEAQALAKQLSHMPGYARAKKSQELELWSDVQKRMEGRKAQQAAEAAPAADEAAGFAYPEPPQEGVPFKSWTPIPGRDRPNDPVYSTHFGAEVSQEGDVWKVTSSSDKAPRSFDTLEEANTFAYGTTVRGMESRFLNSPEGLNTNLEEWNALDQAGREAIIRSTVEQSAPKAQGPEPGAGGGAGKPPGPARPMPGRTPPPEPPKGPLEIEGPLYSDAAERAAHYDSLATESEKQAAKAADARRLAAEDAAAAQAEREAAEAEALALSDMLKDRAGGRTGDSATEVQDHLRRVAGLVGDTADIDHGIAFVMKSKDVRWMMRGIALMDNPADIYRLEPNMPASLIDDLVAAKSEDAVRVAFARGMARGDMDENLGRLRGLRAAARSALQGKDPDAEIPNYEKAFGIKHIKAAQWARQASQSKVPWASARHIADRDGMVRLAYDTITWVFNMKWPGGVNLAGKGLGKVGTVSYTVKGVERSGSLRSFRAVAKDKLDKVESVTYKTKDGKTVTTTGEYVRDHGKALDVDGEFTWKYKDTDYEVNADKFMDEYINRMIGAEDSLTRKEVWDEMLTELTTLAGRQAGLDGNDLKLFNDALALSKYRARHARSLLAEVRAATKKETGSDEIYIDGQLFDGDAATLESELSERVMSPDWGELRRVMSSVHEARRLEGGGPGAIETVNELVTDVFERYWRMSIIAFRGSYIIRNMGDIQVRMFLHGHPSGFTSPQGIMALATSHWEPKSDFGKMLKGLNDKVESKLHLRRGDSKLNGDDLYDDLDRSGNNEVVAEAEFRQQLFIDRMSHFDPGLASPSLTRRLGFQPQKGGDGDFFKGWQFGVAKLQRAPLAVSVLDIMRGKIAHRYQHIMDKYGMDAQDAYVHYLVYGNGRGYLNKFLAGGRKIREMAGDPAEGDRVLARKLKDYLFSEEPGKEFSLASRWRRHTFDFDEELMPLIDDGIKNPQRHSKREAFKKSRELENAIRKRAMSDEFLDDEGNIVWDRLPVLETDAPMDEAGHADVINRALMLADAGFDRFFGWSGKVESAYGYGPEFRYSKWDRAAQLAGVLNAEDAATLLKTAREELGHGLPNSWSRTTLRKIERNAKGKGSGAFTLDQLEYATDAYAARAVQKLFYNAMERNQWAHALRLISPFIQPWANTLKVWTREGAKHYNRVYAAGVVYSAGQGKDSNWMMDDASNPNDAFFYRHAKTGQMMVGVPLMAQGMAGLANGISAVRGGPAIDPSMMESGISMESVNLLFQGGIAPGVGPFVQIPAGMLEQTGWYQSYLPDQVKQVINPSRNTDPEADPTILGMFLPAWFAGGLGALGAKDFTNKAKKYLQPAMTYLLSVNPDNKYWSLDEQGNVKADEAQQLALVEDANQLASSILFGRSIMQNLSPGAPIPEVLIEATDGKVLSTTIIAQQYYDLLQKSGDRGTALAQVVDMYGAGALFTLIPTRKSQYQPTGAAWELVKSNPELAKEYSPILPLVAVNGGYSAMYSRWEQARTGTMSLPPQDMAPWVNDLMKEARLGRLDQKRAAVPPQITDEEYDAQSAAIKAAYLEVPGVNQNEDGSEPDRVMLVKAANDPLMREKFPEMMDSILMYEQARDQALAKAAQYGYKTFSGAASAPIRSWLYDQGIAIMKKNPEFVIPFKRIYKYEVSE